jgi:hypothetical protein
MGSEKCIEQRGQENCKMYLNIDIYFAAKPLACYGHTSDLKICINKLER